MKTLSIGLIGCGNISTAYARTLQRFAHVRLAACCDLDVAAATRMAAEHTLVRHETMADLLADPGVDIAVNLTPPVVHAAVSTAILEAGKHVYSEKPLSTELEAARGTVALARARGLRIGCAPDTVLGSGLQTVRRLLDERAIGRVVGGTAMFLGRGMEHWHPNPAFFFKRGGGPLLDMGPYYVSTLVTLLGPVARVTGLATRGQEVRIVTSEPRRGERIEVEVPTHVSAVLEFVSGAQIIFAASFDVPAHRHKPIELYGTDGSLIVPDPNTFGGPIELYSDGAWSDVPVEGAFAEGNLRGLGVADMALSLSDGVPHRANGDVALHVLEVLTACEESARLGAAVTLATTCERPAAMAADFADRVSWKASV